MSIRTGVRRHWRTYKKAKKAAQNEAVTTAWAIFFSALRDKEGFGYTRLRRVWDEVNYLADSVSKGYVSIADLEKELEDYGITLSVGL